MAIANNRKEGVQRRRTRRDGWTKARRAVFLQHLAATCNITMSAQAAGMKPDGARDLKRRNGEFALLWDQAIAWGRERLEEELLAYALGQVSSGDNPSPDEIGAERATVSLPPFDPHLAIRVLQLRDGPRKGTARAGGAAPSAGDVEAALMKRLEALAARLTR